MKKRILSIVLTLVMLLGVVPVTLTVEAVAKNTVKTTISKLESKAKGFKVTWKKKSKIKGYQIQYSTSSKFKNSTTKTKLINKAKTNTATISKLKGCNKKYYVRVRTYKVSKGKKIYSSWSKVKKITTLKHKYSKSTCIAFGKCKYCKKQATKKGNHIVVTDAAVIATPTTTGLTEGKHCSVCNAILVPQQTTSKDYSSLIDNTTFTLTNDLSEEYYYVASVLYTKCKIENLDYEILPSSANGKIQLKINFQMKKTYQGQSSNRNIKFHYTLSRDGVVVKYGDAIVTQANLDTLYEKTISYTGLPGNYTLTCDDVRY